MKETTVFQSSAEKLKFLGQPLREALPEGEILAEYRSLSERDQIQVANVIGELRAISESQDVIGNEEYELIVSEEKPRGGELGLVDQREMGKRKKKSKKEFKDRGLDRAEEMLVVFNDIQFVQADPEALGAALKFIKANRKQITHFVLNGDILDMEAASKFPKNPDEIGHTSEEIDQANWFLQTISELLPDAKKVFIKGNHEARWENFLKNQTSGVEEFLITLEEKLGLDKLGYEVVDYGRGKFWEWHDLIFWHGSRAGAKSNIPKLELDDTGGVPVVTGHINRNMFHESVDIRGKKRFAMALGGFSKDDLRFVKKANSAWAQGFAVMYYSKQTGIQPYMIMMEHHRPAFIWNGEIFSGQGFKIGDKV